ncbi:ExeA family protein [Thaumasiovibrio subtropicus]|uniref:ExeA family protein n=1 Tax=Thaumasiovibrio subtropicus TaxID=1891207 RepID=UPI000B353A5C|nr:AAA family ATPase [Thaumasiovibrio subtropicus]
MYEAHFGLNQLPFAITPNTALFYALPPHVEAINTALAALNMGEGIIKISGEVGTGKTLLCRMLIKQLPEHYALAYIPTPSQSGEALRRAVAREYELDADSEDLIDVLHRQLIAFRQSEQRAVVIIDEAQALSSEALEAIRLLANLETEQEKLIQVILIGQPELDQRLGQHDLRQLRQRIGFSAKLRPLSLAETRAYIEHRLECSGQAVPLFQLAGYRLLWKASRGIPRLINILCHKAMLHAFANQTRYIERNAIVAAVKDTEDAQLSVVDNMLAWAWR